MRNRSKSVPSARLRALARGAAWPMSLMLACPTVACAQTPKSNFELIRYKLPQTDVSAKISMTLESCGAVPKVSADLAVVGEAKASAAEFPLTTGQLQGAVVKRELKLTLHDTGAIATLGSSNENRLGAIVGDAIKFVAQVVGAAAGLKANSPGGGPRTAPPASICSPEAESALARVKAIDDQLAKWRAKEVPSNPADASAQSKAIDRLTAERAGLRVGVLQADLVKPLDLSGLSTAPAGEPYVVTSALALDKQDLPWLDDDSQLGGFTLTWTVSPPQGGTFPAPAQMATEVCKRRLEPSKPGGKGALGICLPRPVYAKVQVELTAASQASEGRPAPSFKARKVLPMPQWGVVEFLDLKGGDRDVNLSLDKFGRTSEASWTAKARAETVTAGLAGAAEQVAALAAAKSAYAAANSTTARQKVEIDELTTQQTLNRLRACREILATGGSACPEEATGGN